MNKITKQVLLLYTDKLGIYPQLGHAITRSSPRTYKGAQRKTDNPSDLIRETKYPDLLLPGYQTCEEGAAAALTTELLDLAIP